MRRWAPRPVDAAAAAALTVVTQAETWLLAPTGIPVGWVMASWAVGTVACAWHRLAPMPALVVGLTFLAVLPGALGVDPAWSFGWFVGAIALMASAGYHARRPVVALAVALALWAASILLQKGFVPADVLFAWLIATGAWLGGRAVAGRTAQVALSEQRAAVAEQEAHWRAAAAVTEERLRIAREMHDVVAHSLSVVTLHVSGVRRLLRPDQVHERAALETAEHTGRECLAEMQRMLGVLRGPDSGSPASGLDRVPELLESARAAGLAVELVVSGDGPQLPPGPDLAAFRIVQEAVTNVLRHAGAHHLSCSVRYGGAVVELAVVDDGDGEAVSARGGHGLVGMRERAVAYGGCVDAGPSPSGGWAVRATLPVPSAVERTVPA